MAIDETLPIEEQIRLLAERIEVLQKRVYGLRMAPEAAQQVPASAATINTLALESSIAYLQQAVAQINYRLNAGAGVNNIYQFAEGGGVLRVPDMLSGNSGDPRDSTNPFTGTAILYPPVTIGGENYNFVGMENGKLQVGISSDDGNMYAAGGLLNINSQGIVYNGDGVFASTAPGTDRFYLGALTIGNARRFGIHSFSLNGSEKVVNGSFESGALTGWTETGSPTVSSDSPFGQYSVRCTEGNYVTQTFTTTAGKYYLLSMMVKAESGKYADVDGTGWASVPRAWGNTAWTRVLALLQATGTSATLSFLEETSGDDGTVYFDDISLYELAYYSYQGALIDGMGAYRLEASTSFILSSPVNQITAPVHIAESSTPSVDYPGYGAIYPKSDGLWYIKDDAGNEKAIGLAGLYQPIDADLTAIAALTPSEGEVLTWTSGAWTAEPPSGGGGGREQLTANRTYYVRADGNDSNDGLSNTSGGAFLTLQKAADVIAGLDIGIYDVTVQIADGTYTGGVVVAGFWLGSGDVIFQGNSGTPGNVIISTTSVDCFLTTAGAITVQNMELRTTTSGCCIKALGNGSIYYTNIRFGTCAADHIFAGSSGYIECTGNYSIVGAAPCHWRGGNSGGVRCQSKTITITGTPAFSDAFAIASIVGSLTINGNTYSGSATGTRYKVLYNAVIFSGTTLPGNAAGSATGGGEYL